MIISLIRQQGYCIFIIDKSDLIFKSHMIRKIEHLGIAVKDITSSNELFRKLLGAAPYKSEIVEREGVMTSFFQ